MNKLNQQLKKTGIFLSDKVTKFVGSWLFVLLYTGGMILWILLHKIGILHLDGPDFIKWNLWLSYFAGIQASILLMSANRQADHDRRKHELAFRLDKQTNEETLKNQQIIQNLSKQVEDLEVILADMIQEREPHESDSGC